MKGEEEFKSTTIRLKSSLLKKVKVFAVEHEKKENEVFVEAIQEWMDKNGDPK